MTVLMNGVVDDRLFQKKDIPQYNDVEANLNELLLSTKAPYSCPLANSLLVPRHGSMAGFVADSVVTCGGYELATSKYLKLCQQFTEDGKPWKNISDMADARAHGVMFDIPDSLPTKGLYVAGGYNEEKQFLDTIELYDPTADSWSEANFKLPTAKSHFCTVRYYVSISGFRTIEVLVYLANRTSF